VDYSIAHGFNDWVAGSGAARAIAEFLAQDGVFLLLALVAALFLARFAGGRRAAAAAGFSAILALLLAQGLSALVDRARPFVEHPQIHLLIHHARDAGFPSDHATGSFAIATAILLRHRRAGVLAMLLAVLVAVSRVAGGAHYPSDVVAGAVLGAAVGLLLWLPPLRRATDAVARLAGALLDRLLPAT
jgi:undecaprenyl-diphosphatase